ncbi:class I SAM-dependent methyltransferase [Agrococcus sp. ProA11]|uniref:class I SAM-dependent methyltransferase n=1 Tax=Agrococcus chionoecetis TaxID=3153752 RepID=UPI003261B1FE
MQDLTDAQHSDGHRVSHADASAVNRANWDDRVPIHARHYDGLRILPGNPSALTDVVRRDLPVIARLLGAAADDPRPLAGRSLAHLQCHIGTDTVSLAYAGASVIGLDFSTVALEVAAELSTTCGVDARWVHSDVLDAASAIGTQVDVVYTSIGTICWFQDLERWAAQIAQLLVPGGLLYFRDAHPAMLALDDADADALTLAYRYFPNGTALEWIDDTTYASDGERVAHPRTLEWPHSVAEIVTALLDAGLRIVALDEGTVLEWDAHPRMVAVDGGYALPDGERLLVPASLTVAAVRD